MSAHTPGRWYAVSTAVAGDPTMSGWTVLPLNIQDNETGAGLLDEADARLIAAAPDLLAACEAIENWFARTRTGDTLPSSQVEILNRIPAVNVEQVRAAIRRARGETP